MIRLALDGDAFGRLIRGEIVELEAMTTTLGRVPVQLILSDIGFDFMLEEISAQKKAAIDKFRR